MLVWVGNAPPVIMCSFFSPNQSPYEMGFHIETVKCSPFRYTTYFLTNAVTFKCFASFSASFWTLQQFFLSRFRNFLSIRNGELIEI